MTDPSSIRRAQFGRFGHRVDGVAAKLATPAPVETGQLVHLSGMRLEVAGLRSVLIVPCRFCPAASLAVRNGKLINEETLTEDGDTIKLVAVVSGG